MDCYNVNINGFSCLFKETNEECQHTTIYFWANVPSTQDGVLASIGAALL